LLEAQAWAAKNDWEKSWNAWSKFEEIKQKERAAPATN